MVQHGDFLIQLVEAESKAPFKEHYHEGKTFVEVEPDAEYFISITKTGSTEVYPCQRLAVGLCVDGKPLNYAMTINTRYETTHPFFKGIFTYENGVATQTGLKFVTPPKAQEPVAYAAENKTSGIGSVTIKIFEAPKIRTLPSGDRVDAMEMNATTPISQAAGASYKKEVRSSIGTHRLVKAAPRLCGDMGPLVSSITLRYCTTPDLIQMGVLSGNDRESKASETTVNQGNGNAIVKQEPTKRKRKSDESRGRSETEGKNSENDTNASMSDEETVVCVNKSPKAITTIDLTGCDDDDSDSD